MIIMIMIAILVDVIVDVVDVVVNGKYTVHILVGLYVPFWVDFRQLFASWWLRCTLIVISVPVLQSTIYVQIWVLFTCFTNIYLFFFLECLPKIWFTHAWSEVSFIIFLWMIFALTLLWRSDSSEHLILTFDV